MIRTYAAKTLFTHLWRIALLALLAAQPVYAEMSNDEAARLANRLYRGLTGGNPLLPTNPLYSTVVSRVKYRDFAGAALIITDPSKGASEFYNNVVAMLPQTFNREGTPVGSRNEMSAMFLVVTRDGLPLSTLLTEDFTAFDPTITAPSRAYRVDADNTPHYDYVFTRKNARDALKAGTRPGFPGVGIFTSYPWALNYDLAGTGRRNIRGIMENLYCVTMDAMRTNVIPDTATRQDVPRTDEAFVSNCKTCHSWMDWWVRPFLRKDFVNDRLVWLSPVKDKLNNIQAPNYPPVTSPVFDMVYSEEQARILGIDEKSLPAKTGLTVETYTNTGVKFIHGNDMRDFGGIIANSLGFYRCMVKRIIAQVYLHKLFSLATFSEDDMKILNSQSNTIEYFARGLMRTGDLGDTIRKIVIWYALSSGT